MKKQIVLATMLPLMLSVPEAGAWPFHKAPPQDNLRHVLTVGSGTQAAPESNAQALDNAVAKSNIVKINQGNYQDDGSKKAPLLKGQVTYVVPSGTPIKLKLATVPTTGLKMFDRDMDGNLLPAQLGQEITAKTTEDIFVASNKVIPEGTVFHGKVSKIYEPKRLGRPGALALSFDQFTTPDGKSFAFHAEADNIRESTWKSKAKGLGMVAAHAAGGAACGALIAYQLFGMENTVAMHGYNIAGGAAGGALAGIAYAMLRKGSQAVLEPGDDLNLSIDMDMVMPVATAPKPQAADPHLEGFTLEILDSKVVKDGLDGHMLRVDAIITNDSAKRLNSIDLYLEDDNGTRFPVAAGLDEESEYLFRIDPHTRQNIRINFQMEYPKLRRKLVWLDHESRTVLMKERLP